MTSLNERTLTVYSADGLSNRLKVLLSGIALAEARTRIFRMIWNASPGCACTFDALFENPLPVQSQTIPDLAAWQDFRKYPPEKIPDLLAMPAPHLYVHHYGWLITPRTRAAHRPVEMRVQQLLNELQPLAALRTQIDTFRADAFRPRMIGVHLRRGDFQSARQDVVNNLEPACAAVDAFLAQAPDAGILLCTDDGAPSAFDGQALPAQGIRAFFAERYGTRLVAPEPRTLDRRQPEAIQDALVELMLLRATDFFVGTADSTFSEFAVYGRGVPSVMTQGATDRYQSRMRRYKQSGIYYLVRALGRAEYGADVPYDFVARRYLNRIKRMRAILTRKG